MAQVRRAGQGLVSAWDRAGLAGVLGALPVVGGCPRRVRWCSSPGRCGPGPGAGAAGGVFRLCRGRRGSRVGGGARSAPSGRGRPEGVRGGPGTGLWGVPGPPGACTFRWPEVAARYSCIAVRSAAPWALFHGHPCRFCLRFPRSFVRRPARTAFPCTFPGHSCGVAPVLFCLQLPRSLVWWGPPSVRFRIGPPWCLFTRGVEMECSRPRSGRWRRHAASMFLQAAGGIEPEPRRTAPASPSAALYGRCMGCVRAVWVVVKRLGRAWGAGSARRTRRVNTVVSPCRNLISL
jgi:hypothetical protein